MRNTGKRKGARKEKESLLVNLVVTAVVESGNADRLLVLLLGSAGTNKGRAAADPDGCGCCCG